jgi:DNA repair protein RadC
MYKWQQFEVKLIRSAAQPRSRLKVENTASIARIFRQHAEEADQESLWIIALSGDRRLIGVQELYRGNSSMCLVSLVEVFRLPIVLNASGFVLVHNHPTGLAKASNPDLELTKEVYRLATELGLDFLDAVVVGVGGKYSSIRASLRGTGEPIWHDHLFPGTCLELGDLCKVRPTESAQSA